MNSIMTLSLEQFHFIDDLFSLTMILMASGALFLFLSSFTTLQKMRPAVIGLGIAMAVGSYYYLRLFQNWNEAFELAGISYAASGHSFREAYRYSAWLIMAPVLVIVLCAPLGLIRRGCNHFIIRAALVSEVMVFSAYLMTFLGESRGASFLLALAMIGSFVYLGFLFYKQLPGLVSQEYPVVGKLFLRVRNILFLSWLLSGILMALNSMNALQTAPGLVFTITISALLDLIALGGVGICVCWIMFLVSQSEPRIGFSKN